MARRFDVSIHGTLFSLLPSSFSKEFVGVYRRFEFGLFSI